MVDDDVHVHGYTTECQPQALDPSLGKITHAGHTQPTQLFHQWHAQACHLSLTVKKLLFFENGMLNEFVCVRPHGLLPQIAAPEKEDKNMSR